MSGSHTPSPAQGLNRTASIALYSYDGKYLEHITVKRAMHLEGIGRVTIVRHKKGYLNRVILLRGEGDPPTTHLRDYMGQSYSFRQPLPDGLHVWKLRPLQGGRSDTNLAPADVRPIFLRVLLDCLVQLDHGDAAMAKLRAVRA
jgi:hypothetical protein